MHFDEEFFKTEIRDGFEVSSMMKRAWAAQMEILQKVNEICQANGIKMFAAWGTLIGAVRHNGFIPWDDDIDIWVKREDYNKLIEIMKQEKDSTFHLLHHSTSPEYGEYFLRITNGTAINLSKEHLERFHGCPYVVGIDVFPLDYISRDSEEAELQKELVKIAHALLSVCGDGRIFEESESCKNTILQLENLCHIKLNWDNNTKHELWKLCDILYSICDTNSSDTLTEYYYYCKNPEIQFPKNFFDESIMVDFENTKICVPKEYDSILTILFGDWRTPVRNTQDHEYPFYKGQEQILKKYLEENGENIDKDIISKIEFM